MGGLSHNSEVLSRKLRNVDCGPAILAMTHWPQESSDQSYVLRANLEGREIA